MKGVVGVMNQESFLRVEVIQEYDVANQKSVEHRNIKISTQSLQTGLIKELGGTEYCVLCAIASFCDVEGEAFPSQRKLAEITGFSLPTINKAVAKLLETEINGVPVIARELESMGSKKRFSVYSLYVQEEEAEKKKTARDYVSKFKYLFEEKYGFPYVVNYGRDTSLIKKKLMSEFEEGDVDAIIEYAVENYESKWANSKYPYPTISMVCTWLANAVMKELIQEKKKADELQRRMAEAEETALETEANVDRLLSL